MNRSGRLAAQGALVLLVCFVGQACVTKARGWRVETVDHDGNVGHTLSLSLDKTDHPHISYHEYTRCGHPAPPCDANLRYTHFNGASWKIEVVEDLREGLLTGRDSSLVLDKDGYPHISYGGDVLIPVSDGTYSLTNRYALQYIYYDGFTWQPAEVIAYGGTYPSLAVDEANQVHVSYFDTLNGTLNYAHRSGSTWVVAIVDEVEEHYGASASLALDSVGMPHLSY